MTLKKEILDIARRARETSPVLANLSTGVKNGALRGMADALLRAAPALRKARRFSALNSSKRCALRFNSFPVTRPGH